MNLKKCLSLAVVVALFLPSVAFADIIIIDASSLNNEKPAASANTPLFTTDPETFSPEQLALMEELRVACNQASEIYWTMYHLENQDPFLTEAVRQQYSLIQDAATAKPQMVWVEIPVWKINKKGVKYSATAKVEVLSSIAEQVRAIFTEIYQGEEKFPIEYVGGYNWRKNGLSSYHSAGLAIDINPTWNPQYAPDFSSVLTGKAWEPGKNPYSISQDSDVLKVFGKYGWIWGAWFPRADFMHFEFHP